MRRSTSLFLCSAAVLQLTVTACAGNSLGSIGDILGMPAPADQGTVTVEIRAVNTQQQLIQVATQSGETADVQYDSNTVVYYQNQQYPVTALERGDIAVLTVQQRQNASYVSRVDVQQSVQERTGSTTTSPAGAVVQLSGTIANMNQANGSFTLRTSSGNATIYLPSNAPQATVNYFRQLRNGNSVRLEGLRVGTTNEFDIYRFL